MNRPRYLSHWLTTPVLAALLFSGCREVTVDPDEPTIRRTVVRTTPGMVDIVQGEIFTIEAWNEWSDGRRTGPALDVFSYPEGLERVGAIARGPVATTIDVRGLQALETTLTLTVGGAPLEDGVPVRVREAGLEILANPLIFEDEGETRMVILPTELGQTLSVGAVATNGAGCPVPGGANVLDVDATGDVGSFAIDDAVFGRTVSKSGCPVGTDAAVDVDFSGEAIASSIGFNYDLRGRSEPAARLDVAVLPVRFAPETAASGLPALGTIVRQSTTCGPFQPGTFDFSATLLYDESNGLRIVNADGSAFQGAEAPLGSWTFTSAARSLGNGFSVQETILTGEIGYSREIEGAISLQWFGLSRIDYFDEGTGAKVCDETATHFASARIPRFGFRFHF